MHKVEQLADEIRFQLKEDILSFGWMVQIAQLQNPKDAPAAHVNAVFEAIILLRASDEIVVGAAKNVAGHVRIEPWPEQGEELRSRLIQTSDSATGLDRDFCFWIQSR